jgi:lysylphosphatidylglycerol synthetase-like protein (DUF2156 family)
MIQVDVIPSNLSIDPREQFLREFGGSSLSYSSLQEGMDFFYVPKLGYIAYSPIKADFERPLCLAEPICARENLEELIRLFLEKHKGAVFLHVTKETATVLSKLGFSVNEIGVETIMDVQTFNLSGGGKEFLRSQRNRAAKDGLTVRELSSSEVPPGRLEEISAQWMTGKANNQELSFLVRPAKYEDETDVRKFYAFRNDRIIGFQFFDPIYRDGKVVGYLDNIHRSTNEVSYSVSDCINLEAMRQFKSEGRETLSLGFSALHALNDSGEFHFSSALKKILEYFDEHCNFLYDFRGSAFHKTRYRPGTDGCREIKIYVCVPTPVPIFHVDKVFKRCGVDPIKRLAERGIDWGMAIGAHAHARRLGNRQGTMAV